MYVSAELTSDDLSMQEAETTIIAAISAALPDAIVSVDKGARLTQIDVDYDCRSISVQIRLNHPYGLSDLTRPDAVYGEGHDMVFNTAHDVIEAAIKMITTTRDE